MQQSVRNGCAVGEGLKDLDRGVFSFRNGGNDIFGFRSRDRQFQRQEELRWGIEDRLGVGLGERQFWMDIFFRNWGQDGRLFAADAILPWGF